MNRSIEKMNALKSKWQKLTEEIEVLREGNITLDGMTYKHVPYPKGREFKPYLLASMSKKDLKKEMQIGKLRVQERYDNHLIRSFSYRGQSITVAELALINPAFPNKALTHIEQKLEAPYKKLNVPKNRTSDHQGRKKAYLSRARRQAYIPKINTQANDNEAHWHAQQAAWAIENNQQS